MVISPVIIDQWLSMWPSWICREIHSGNMLFLFLWRVPGWQIQFILIYLYFGGLLDGKSKSYNCELMLKFSWKWSLVSLQSPMDFGQSSPNRSHAKRVFGFEGVLSYSTRYLRSKSRQCKQRIPMMPIKADEVWRWSCIADGIMGTCGITNKDDNLEILCGG